MPTFKITNPETGNIIRVTGDSPPNESEINQIFASVGNNTDLDLDTVVSSNVEESEKINSLDQRIEDRGTAFIKERTDEWLQSSGITTPALRGLRIASAPQEKTEAAIANAMIALQEGRFDEIVSDFKSGAKGERLGQIGDVFRNSNVPILKSEPVAATAGFLISMISPLTLISKANKALKGVLKATDKKMIKAGESLIKGSDDAVNVIGRNLEKAYAPVNEIPVDGLKLIQSFDDAPQLLIKNIEKQLGRNLDDLAQTATVQDVRKIKGLVGELKPSAFGKESKGLVETIETKNINKTYSNVKNLIQETLETQGLSFEAKQLLKADEAFRETFNASRFIKRSVIDPTLLKPTKGGKVALGLIKEGDTTTRLALETLRGAGKHARKNINDALDALNKYNRHLATTSLLTTTAKAAVFGGAVGAVGGKAAGTVLGR